MTFILEIKLQKEHFIAEYHQYTYVCHDLRTEKQGIYVK